MASRLSDESEKSTRLVLKRRRGGHSQIWITRASWTANKSQRRYTLFLRIGTISGPAFSEKRELLAPSGLCSCHFVSSQVTATKSSRAHH